MKIFSITSIILSLICLSIALILDESNPNGQAFAWIMTLVFAILSVIFFLFNKETQNNTDCNISEPFDKINVAELLISENYKDSISAIIADGGTEKIIIAKIEVLLDKRIKSREMLDIELPIRSMYNSSFDRVMDEVLSTSNNDCFWDSKYYDEICYRLQEARTFFNNEGYAGFLMKKLLIEIANPFFVSVNLIEEEEYQKALAKLSQRNRSCSF